MPQDFIVFLVYKCYIVAYSFLFGTGSPLDTKIYFMTPLETWQQKPFIYMSDNYLQRVWTRMFESRYLTDYCDDLLFLTLHLSGKENLFICVTLYAYLQWNGSKSKLRSYQKVDLFQKWHFMHTFSEIGAKANWEVTKPLHYTG